jgi:hypothetical protein
MFFKFSANNKTVKDLRKSIGYTAKELALQLKLDESLILKVDNYKLKDIPEPLKSKIIPILRGDNLHKAPWL